MNSSCVFLFRFLSISLVALSGFLRQPLRPRAPRCRCSCHATKSDESLLHVQDSSGSGGCSFTSPVKNSVLHSFGYACKLVSSFFLGRPPDSAARWILLQAPCKHAAKCNYAGISVPDNEGRSNRATVPRFVLLRWRSRLRSALVTNFWEQYF